ncbi:MAG: FecR domain-containing protein [Tannerellaceae bacterium]|nr:FecR domain-containing protein [Tannerellaceae bacterium]
MHPDKHTNKGNHTLFERYIKEDYTEEEIEWILEQLKEQSIGPELQFLSRQLWETIPGNEFKTSTIKEKQYTREALELIRSKNKMSGQRKQNPYRYFQRIAATLLLLITIGTGGWLLTKNGHTDSSISYRSENTSKGEIRHISLPDGTQVTLNAGTTLTIPDNYHQKERVVYLEGEAFFDVIPDQEKPFYVESEKSKIKVVGTSFNVKSYGEDVQLAITVTTGKVQVELEELEMMLNLNPKDHLSVNKINRDFDKRTLENNHYIQWMNGLLYFEKEPLTEVIKKINRFYDREIILQTSGEKEYVISGTHDNKSLEAVLEAICFATHLNYKTENNKLILYESKRE